MLNDGDVGDDLDLEVDGEYVELDGGYFDEDEEYFDDDGEYVDDEPEYADVDGEYFDVEDSDIDCDDDEYDDDDVDVRRELKGLARAPEVQPVLVVSPLLLDLPDLPRYLVTFDNEEEDDLRRQDILRLSIPLFHGQNNQNLYINSWRNLPNVVP